MGQSAAGVLGADVLEAGVLEGGEAARPGGAAAAATTISIEKQRRIKKLLS
jgi:hypothetical protein